MGVTPNLPAEIPIKILVRQAEAAGFLHQSNIVSTLSRRAADRFESKVNLISPPSALDICANLLVIAAGVGDEKVAQHTINLAGAFLGTEGLSRPAISNFEISRAIWLLSRGETQQAENVVQRLAEGGDLKPFPDRHVQALDLLGLAAYTQKRPDDALKLLSDAAGLCGGDSSVQAVVKAKIFTDLAGIELITGDTKSSALHAALASSLYDRSVPEELASLSLAQGFAIHGFERWFSSLDLILNIGSPEQKLQVLSRRKGLVLKGVFNSEDSRTTACERTRSLRSRLFARDFAADLDLSGHSTASEDSTEVLIEGLQAAEHDCHQPASRRDISVADLVKAIPAHAAVLDFISYPALVVPPPDSGKPFGHGEEMVGALILSSTGIQWENVGTVADLTKLSSAIASLTPAPYVEQRPLTKALQNLHHELWTPIQKMLPANVDTIYVSPDAPVNFVPFAVLLDEEQDFVGERYSFIYLQSIRDLVKRRPQIHGSNRIFGFFLTQSPGWQFASTHQRLRIRSLPELTHAEDELTAFTTAGFSTKPIVLSNDAATKRAVEGVRNPWLLHICSHSLYLQDVVPRTPLAIPLNEGIDKWMTRSLAYAIHANLLTLYRSSEFHFEELVDGAEPDKNDGLLSLEDIAQLPLSKTELVSLSGCSTQLSDAYPGEGLIGMQRAFHAAGARCVVLSLWQVLDPSARKFFGPFYQRLANGASTEIAFGETVRDFLHKSHEVLLKDLILDVGCYIISVDAINHE